jgi:hypothetical protein
MVNPERTEKDREGARVSLYVAIRLGVIPLTVYAGWLLETFLLEKNRHLFAHIDPGALIFYTVVVCIATGIVIPVFILRKSFLSGDVNMFQIGFRSLSRTITACIGTLIAGYVAVILFSPFGSDRGAFAGAFLLLLPTAMAATMICWVLAGTHIQAYVRGGGSRVSIPAGVVATALLFGLTSLAHSAPGSTAEAFSWSILAGIAAAIFFFSVRDVYATMIVVAGLMVFLMAGSIDTLNLSHPAPAVFISSGLAAVVLAGVHLFLFRNYATIRIPVRP